MRNLQDVIKVLRVFSTERPIAIIIGALDELQQEENLYSADSIRDLQTYVSQAQALCIPTTIDKQARASLVNALEKLAKILNQLSLNASQQTATLSFFPASNVQPFSATPTPAPTPISSPSIIHISWGSYTSPPVSPISKSFSHIVISNSKNISHSTTNQSTFFQPNSARLGALDENKADKHNSVNAM